MAVCRQAEKGREDDMMSGLVAQLLQTKQGRLATDKIWHYNTAQYSTTVRGLEQVSVAVAAVSEVPVFATHSVSYQTCYSWRGGGGIGR